jgi:ornithine cyclodeaminase/alanine dehydrogenase
MALYLTEQDVSQLLTMEETLEAVEGVFKSQASGDATNQPRRRVRARGAVLMTMSGAVDSLGVFGLKSYTVASGGAQFYVSLFDAVSGELLAFIEADKLGQMRTGAATGVATKYLAKPGAATVGIYGTGWQAESQLEAVSAVRRIESVRVYSRSAERRVKFSRVMSERLKIKDVRAVEQPREAAEAEILITITSSREPVLLGEWVRPGVHINAAGGNSVLRAELDDKAVRRASFIAVDSLEQAKMESGEFVNAVEKGMLVWERVQELRHVVSGALPGRSSGEDITLFKSLGIAIEDVAAAAAIYKKAKAQQVGREI